MIAFFHIDVQSVWLYRTRYYSSHKALILDAGHSEYDYSPRSQSSFRSYPYYLPKLPNRVKTNKGVSHHSIARDSIVNRSNRVKGHDCAEYRCWWNERNFKDIFDLF